MSIASQSTTKRRKPPGKSRQTWKVGKDPLVLACDPLRAPPARAPTPRPRPSVCITLECRLIPFDRTVFLLAGGAPKVVSKRFVSISGCTDADSRKNDLLNMQDRLKHLSALCKQHLFLRSSLAGIAPLPSRNPVFFGGNTSVSKHHLVPNRHIILLCSPNGVLMSNIPL